MVSNGQKKWEEILALGLDETKWREIFKLPFIVTQNTKLPVEKTKKNSHVKFSSLSIMVFQAWNTSFQTPLINKRQNLTFPKIL
jgi:hypothetical protein